MILTFPKAATGHAPHMGASRLVILLGRLRDVLGRTLNAIGAPGAIRPVALKDEVTGTDIQVSVSALFVRLSVNGRDYYFDRLSGRFDGTGMGCG